ncbi:MAG: efflux RND transporter periplasmic adaptor subunit [Proteobacteria bacterium]|nr:efflux RND transporter periplasmic adaptor subunit [Pseudomonadota bacterium]
MTDERRASQLASLKIVRPAESESAPEGARRWPLLAGAGIAGALVAGIAVWLLAGRPPSEPATSASTKPSDAAAPTPAARPVDAGSLVAAGYVVARRRATVAAEITGRVSEVLVDEGMAVKQGQLLARLDDTLAATDLATANSRVDSASASLAATRAQLADAERILKRTQDLARNHLASEADLTKADTQVIDLRAQVARTEAELATARSDARRAAELVGKHRIVAPFTGIVVDKNAQPGEIISPMSAGGGFTRTGICTLVDMDSLEIEVDVNEAYISRVRPEQGVKATLDAYPDWTIPARVIAIVPTADRAKATVKVRIAILSKDPRILPDMAVKVAFASGDAGRTG